MKSLIPVFVIFVVLSCNKSSKSTGIPIDVPSLNQMVENYATYTEGDIYFGCIDATNEEAVLQYNVGFSAILFDSTINYSNRKSLKLGKVSVGDLDLFTVSHINTYNNKEYFYYMSQGKDNSYVSSLFNNKIVAVEVFDTLYNSISFFNFVTPKKLHIKRMETEIDSEDIQSLSLIWNADMINKVGLVAEVTSFNNGAFEKRAVFLADDGSEKIINIVGDMRGEVGITLYRGVIIIKTGTDNRKYKITCKAQSSIELYIK